MDENLKCGEMGNSTSVTGNDSMLDFKSPVLSSKGKLNEFINYNVYKKLKPATRLKNVPKKHKGKDLKKQLDKKKNIQESTPSIESSFFKFEDGSNDKNSNIDVEVALVCPLCFKIFKDINSRTLHMKICACKNNIPTKKLLDAIDLQKRQADERISLGLVPIPAVQGRKKSGPPRTCLGEESDLQLGIALSRSLQEAEALNTINQNAGVLESLNQIVIKVNKSLHEEQLEKFGFAHSKLPVHIKNKKKKCNTVTLLHTRSREERIHILAKRISEILMADEPISQNLNVQSKQKHEIKEETTIKILKSRLLQDLFNKEGRLWMKAQLSQNRKCFYVTHLSKHIIPEEDQDVEMDLEFSNTSNLLDMQFSKCPTEASKNETNLICPPSFTVNNECVTCQDRQFINNVINNWASILNSSSASDVIILVNDDKHIWAHKLVFHVQCSNILLDIVPNDTFLCSGIKDKICWMDVPHHVALAFVEFIYCGTIQKYIHIFENTSCFLILRNLARKYRVKELFVLLNQKEMKTKENNAAACHEYKKMTLKDKYFLDLNDDNWEELIYDSKHDKLDKCRKVIKYDLDKFIVNNSKFSSVESKEDTKPNLYSQEKRNYLDDLSTTQISNVSPDLFDEINYTLQSDIESREKYVDEISSTVNESKDENTILHNLDNHVNTEISGPSNSGCTASSKSVEENIKRFSSPPPSSTPKRFDHSFMRKPKSRLSLFIEHFQVENEKSIVDSVSESSLLATTPKLCRNPFRIKQCYTFNENSAYNKGDTLGVMQKEKELNIFDHGISSNSPQLNASHIENCVNDGEKLQSADNDTQSSEINIAPSTEPYKKNNLVSECSNITQKKLEVVYATSKNSLNESTKRLKNLHGHMLLKTCSETQCNNNENNMSLDSDTDESEISMYSKYRRQRESNSSIVKYRNFEQKQISQSDVEQSNDSAERKNTENNSTLQVNANQTSEFGMISLAEHDSPIYTKNNKCIVNNRQTILDSRKINNSSKLKYSKSENNFEIFKKSSYINEYHIPTAPVLSSSNFNSDNDILNKHVFWESNMKKSSSHFEKSARENTVIPKDIHLANTYITNDDEDSCDSFFINEANNLSNETVSIVETSKNIPHVMDESIIKVKNGEGYLHMKQNDIKNEENSAVQANYYTHMKEIKNITLSFCNNCNKTLCMCGHAKYLEQHMSSEIMRNSVTPPPNYNNMLTPELHAELNKYGLKAQKRKRAVKLLTYIYNELHPVICITPNKIESEFVIMNNDEDEPPQKKIKSKQKEYPLHIYESQFPLSQKSSKNVQLLANISDEEEGIFDPGSTYTTDITPNIKDMILKFLTVEEELYNKILAYEPLCINSLHSMLKIEGLKCSINTLMDFLDEQCITFYIQEKLKQV